MEKIIKNQVKLELLSVPENVSIARITIAALASQLELTLNELEEIKVATSEAVSNAIIHGYQNKNEGLVQIIGTIQGGMLTIEIIDQGIGIPDIKKAMEPAFSTDPERMGLGFVFMQSFMDSVKVESEINTGTKVTLCKKIAGAGLNNKAVS